MTSPLPISPKSICILRLSAIGDVVHMVPIVRTLQHQWPKCKITWIIGKLEASLVDDLPGVEFIIFDKTTGLKSFWQLWRRLYKRQFDLLLHMQVALRASIISLVVPAPVKLGFDRSRAHNYQWLFTNHHIDGKSQQHVLDGFFGFLEKIGINKRYLEWNIPIPPEVEKRCRQLVPEDRSLLLINACSSSRPRNWRNWPAERYAEIADYAAMDLDLRVVLTGGPARQETDLATEISRLSQNKPTNLVGRTSLKELLALINIAKVLIAPDTGPAHMAAAAGTPVIGLYATSNPLRTGPYLNQELVINHYPQALQTYSGKTVDEARWGERVRHPYAMHLITVAEVKSKLAQVINHSDS